MAQQTAVEKAAELINKMYYTQSSPTNWVQAKECALIAVNEILDYFKWEKSAMKFWQEVKQEIEAL